jgi:hypothetical protein
MRMTLLLYVHTMPSTLCWVLIRGPIRVIFGFKASKFVDAWDQVYKNYFVPWRSGHRILLRNKK